MTQPEGIDWDAALRRASGADEVRAMADQRAADYYVGNPTFADAADDWAQYFAAAICEGFDADYATDPAVPTLLSAYKKLCFAFIDAEDYSSLTDRTVAAMCEGLLNHAARQGEAWELQTLATTLDSFAAYMFFLWEIIRDESDFSAKSPDEQFAYVEQRFEEALAEISESKETQD